MKNNWKYIVIVSVITIIVAVSLYIGLRPISYEELTAKAYKEMIKLPKDISENGLEKMGYINLKKNDISAWESKVNEYNVAFANNKAYGFYFFEYPKLYYLAHNPAHKSSVLWEYNVAEGMMENLGLTYFELKKDTQEDNIRYILTKRKKSDIVADYATQERVIYSYANMGNKQ